MLHVFNGPLCAQFKKSGAILPVNVAKTANLKAERGMNAGVPVMNAIAASPVESEQTSTMTLTTTCHGGTTENSKKLRSQNSIVIMCVVSTCAVPIELVVMATTNVVVVNNKDCAGQNISLAASSVPEVNA